jgi:uncharacterized protein YcbK (DUF882 family)
MVYRTRSFVLQELRCHDGTAVPERHWSNALAVMKRAQVLRDRIGEPLQVLSGYRTAAWNRRVGGAAHSQHLTASAMDLVARTLTPVELHRVYLELIGAGLVEDGGLGLYPSFIHIDIGRPRRWRGPNERK